MIKVMIATIKELDEYIQYHIAYCDDLYKYLYL